MQISTANSNRARYSRRRRGGAEGFTIIEMLTVLFIIGLLMSILVPTVGTVATAIARTDSLATIRQLEDAIHQYHMDFGDYPPSGARNLTEHLTFYKDNDGHVGFGMRKEVNGKFMGKVYGPYGAAATLETDDSSNPVFVDAFDNTIEYSRFENNSYSGGGIPNGDYAKDENGKYFRTDYILCTPGPNGKWWTEEKSDRGISTSEAQAITDDVTNFLEED